MWALLRAANRTSKARRTFEHAGRCAARDRATRGQIQSTQVSARRECAAAERTIPTQRWRAGELAPRTLAGGGASCPIAREARSAHWATDDEPAWFRLHCHG